MRGIVPVLPDEARSIWKDKDEASPALLAFLAMKD